MAQQNYTWPAVSVTATNPSVGTNGATAPTFSTEVGGIGPDGNLHGISTDNSGNQNVNVVSSALPTGAATAANQVTGNNSLASIDTKTPALGQALAAASVPVVLTAAQLSTLTPLTTVTVVQPTGTNLHVVVDSSALPSGASTSALQTTGNTSLASIDTKTPALGQALAAASVPVVLTAAQLTTLTPLTSVTVTQATGSNLHTVVDSGSITVTQATGTNLHAVVDSGSLTVTQATGSNLHAVLDAGTAIVGKVGIDQTTPGTTNGVQINAALPAGTNNLGKVNALASTPAALTVTQAAKTVGTTAVRLTVSGSAPASTRVVLVATPDSTATGKFYIGSSTVTSTGATRGIQIVSGQTFIANSDAGDYYIISDTAAQIVEVMEQA